MVSVIPGRCAAVEDRTESSSRGSNIANPVVEGEVDRGLSFGSALNFFPVFVSSFVIAW